MLDRLTTIIVDHFTDSLDLHAMGHLKKLTSFFSRQEYCKATLSRGHRRSCCTEHSLQHLGSVLFTKSICDRCLKNLQPLSSSNLPSLVLDNCLFGQIISSSPGDRVSYSPSIFEYCFPIRVYVVQYFEYRLTVERPLL